MQCACQLVIQFLKIFNKKQAWKEYGSRFCFGNFTGDVVVGFWASVENGDVRLFCYVLLVEEFVICVPAPG